MYQVLTKDGLLLGSYSDLDHAMSGAKTFNQFVTIRSLDGMEFVGKFGADAIVDGKTSDGIDYEWKKEFSLKKRYKKG